MGLQPDVSVYDSDGNVILAVEVKNKPGTDRNWAVELRRNMFVHGLLPNAEYFLLALPDRFYLWQGRTLSGLEHPTYEIDPSRLLNRYYARADINPEALSGLDLELLISSMLDDLRVEGLAIDDDWLVTSGLLDKIRRGTVVLNTAA